MKVGAQRPRQTSRVDALDTLLAHKVISLTGELNGTEKRVAAALIDSFNRRTAQCDPGFGRLAGLLGISRRTVIRAINRIERAHFVRRIRHGGKSHRNSYVPNWTLFLELEERWKHRMKNHKAADTEESLLCRQNCHLGGGDDGTQTSLINQFKITECARPQLEAANASIPRKQAADRLQFKPPIREGTRPLQAATTAAERRWSTDLIRQFASDPENHAKIIEAIDASLQDKATQAELLRRGAGIELILRDVRRQLDTDTASHD
jgi:hypothetical protein